MDSPLDSPKERAARTLANRIAGSLPELSRFVRRRMGRELHGRESVSDIVQSTARELLGGARFEDRGEASFQRWLRVAAEHKIKNRARRWRAFGRDRSQSLAVLASQQVHSSVSSPASPSQDAVLGEESARLTRAIGSLPDEYRVVIQRVHLDGGSYSEVARELGRSPEAARKLLTRALARLSSVLASERQA